jgi:hypothetical protein
MEQLLLDEVFPRSKMFIISTWALCNRSIILQSWKWKWDKPFCRFLLQAIEYRRVVAIMKHEDTQRRRAYSVFNALNANNACWSITNLLTKNVNNYTFCTLKIYFVIRAPGTRATMENPQSIVLVCDPLCWGHVYLNNVYIEFLKGRRRLFGDVSCRQIRSDSPYMLMSGTVGGCQRELNAEGSTIT